MDRSTCHGHQSSVHPGTSAFKKVHEMTTIGTKVKEGACFGFDVFNKTQMLPQWSGLFDKKSSL